MASTAELMVNNLCVQFGGLKAVDEVSFALKEQTLAGLIGPNGAGKTTIFNALTGLCPVSGGEISFNNQRLTNQPAHTIARYGIARTFQNIRLFKNLTVLDNLRIAYHKNRRYSLLCGLFRSPAFQREEAQITGKAREALELAGLADKAHQLAGNLPYGEQRRVEIARALMLSPKLLLLDEPAAGMNPQETQDLLELIRELRDSLKITILLIEHDMKLVMNLCEKLFVLDHGHLIATGDPKSIQTDRRVVEAYLGGSLN
ncbi:MAG: ABC transporter ATP-binding protein [Limnochordia bacterium]|jgi:branched-chain amino acid transport system ATP-binding protein|nr:ABC transporter ATP-binding protein [Limnochordia bacterium]MDI9466131.1 ABC transporter ATP-binding protein [Bacillota bacterium]NLO96065.1 ABC transporter ATP-binding protein [Bacillota bacterium]HOB41086.1 ABC transporter ATP-binding protein [Limnochordia bacterium]HOK31898.1 ABC transporter ATP-binding protein [Limnochordia bacterium]